MSHKWFPLNLEGEAATEEGPGCVPARGAGYTQFAIQDSRLFGPNPSKILAPPSSYLSNKGFWATQPLEQILVAEFLLCELGVLLIEILLP